MQDEKERVNDSTMGEGTATPTNEEEVQGASDVNSSTVEQLKQAREQLAEAKLEKGRLQDEINQLKDTKQMPETGTEDITPTGMKKAESTDRVDSLAKRVELNDYCEENGLDSGMKKNIREVAEQQGLSPALAHDIVLGRQAKESENTGADGQPTPQEAGQQQETELPADPATWTDEQMKEYVKDQGGTV